MSTASTAALSSVLSALNNGSTGIDVASAVASIIAADRAPETLWASQQTTLNNQAAALQQLESEATSVTEALQTLGDTSGALASVSATSSNTAVLTATAAANSAAGSHSIVVNSLATTGSWYSADESSSSASLGSGSFDISVNGNTQTFTTGAGVDTLDELASSVNASGIGVTASVVNDANGARLALVAQGSGSAADLSIANDSGLQFTQGVAGANASLTVDGVPVSSATNTVTGVISGLTLNLQSTNTSASPVTVSTGADTSSIDSAVNTFVSAYNALIKDLNGQFTFSSSTTSEGVLGADSVARSIQSDILAAANLNIGTGTIQNLSALGVTTNQDGTLSLNTDTLNDAVSADPQAVTDFFQGSSGTPGYASTVIDTLQTYTNTSQGAFTVDLQSLKNEYQDLSDQTTNFELYIAQQQTVLTAEYNNANIALQQLPEQIKQIQALLGTDNSGSNS